MSWYGWYEKRPTIRTDKGIRVRAGRKGQERAWWSGQWIEALERLMDSGRLGRGRSYARAGQVLSLEETAGGIAARVQGSRRQPYRVTIALEHLSEAQWEAVLDALAQEARFAAELLAGQMPRDIETVFEGVGAALFPTRGHDPHAHDLSASCSCPDWAAVCKHIAATHYVLAERFDADPFLLFRLRGRTQDEILAGLRARHGAATGDAVAHEREPEEEFAEPGPPLAGEMTTFWRMAHPLETFTTHIAPPAVRLPALQRLGPAPFADTDLAAHLEPIYDAVTEAAVQAAH